MTVSPQWPDEGKTSQFPEVNPDLAEPVGPPDALPPTLFQLPNLRVDRRADTLVTEDSEAKSTRATPDFTNQVAEMPFGNVGTVEVPVGLDSTAENASLAELRHRGDDAIRVTTPPVVVDGTETYAIQGSDGVNRESISRHGANNLVSDSGESMPPAPLDRPASRSWMDSIGSHGIVVALLLIVVAAALYTGRAGKDSSVDSSLADGRDWLEYDTGEEISLPNAAVVDGSAIDTISNSESALAQAKTLGSDGRSDSAIVPAKSQGGEQMSSSTALLSQPVEAENIRFSDSGSAGANAGLASGQFQQPHASLTMPATSVANRASQNPSQSRGTGQSTGNGIAVTGSQGPKYQQTATPAGINDWSKYLPRVSSGNLARPTYPSPSN